MNPAARISERDNLLTPLRLALAAIVAFWHGAVIAADGAREFSIHGLSPSYVAVNGFFILSGVLIARSARRRDLAHYAAARILRLYPALIALLAAGTALALALHVLHPETPSEPGSWTYPLRSLLFMNASGGFPGVFAANPRAEFDLSLWTLRYEALAYIGLPVLLAAGLLRTARRAWAVWACAAALFTAATMLPAAPAIAHEGLRLACAFLLGAAIDASAGRLRAGPVELACALAAALVLLPTPAFEPAADLVIAWALVFVGFARIPAGSRLARIPDWSYGLYIWHWPVFQALKGAFPDAAPGAILIAGLALSLAAAAASWRYVERPALARTAALAAWLRAAFRRPRPAQRAA